MFQSTLWPSLVKLGWQQQDMSRYPASHDVSTAPGTAAYTPPADVIAAVQAATGYAPTGPCASPLAVLALLACAALPVPSSCLQEVRAGVLNGSHDAACELLAARFGGPPKSKQFVSPICLASISDGVQSHGIICQACAVVGVPAELACLQDSCTCLCCTRFCGDLPPARLVQACLHGLSLLFAACSLADVRQLRLHQHNSVAQRHSGPDFLQCMWPVLPQASRRAQARAAAAARSCHCPQGHRQAYCNACKLWQGKQARCQVLQRYRSSSCRQQGRLHADWLQRRR